jgi:DNA/RNA-binding protein KIN17
MKYEDYDNEPIDSFGKNMLLKMGWNENEAKNSVKPYEIKPRHFRLGLGATPLDPTKNIPKFSNEENDKKEKKKNFFGTKIKIVHGDHRDLKGIIAEKILCEDLKDYLSNNKYVKIELKINKEILNIETKNIKIKKKDSNKDNKKKKEKKDKKKKSKKDKKEKKDRRKYLKSRSSSNINSQSESKSEIESEKNAFNDYNNKDQNLLNKKRERSYSKESRSSKEIKNKEKKFDIDINIMNNIYVRIIDKKHKYYNKKVMVIDIPDKNTITVITSENKMIEGLNKFSVEPILPNIGEKLMILKGENKGEIAQLMFIDEDKKELTVQIFTDFSIKIYKFNECSAI